MDVKTIYPKRSERLPIEEKIKSHPKIESKHYGLHGTVHIHTIYLTKISTRPNYR
jgi:hypothetical protein